MSRALAASTLTFLAGAGLTGALAWAFLSTPESTVFMLALSAALAVAIYLVVAVTFSTALGAWTNAARSAGATRIVRGVVLFLPASVAVGVAWWVVGRGLAALAAHTGEISAWFIAAADWADVRPLLGALAVAGEWLRQVVVPFAALTWMAGRLSPAGAARSSSRRVTWPVRLVLVTVLALATLWAPFAYGLYWRPGGLPPSWIEPAVAFVKFGVMAALAALGLGIITGLASPLPNDADPSLVPAHPTGSPTVVEAGSIAPPTTYGPR